MGNHYRRPAEAIVHPDAVNREAAKDEPPVCRGRGPAAFYATALWLRDAYADLRWEVHNVVTQGELVVLHCTMSGRHRLAPPPRDRSPKRRRLTHGPATG